MHSLDIDVVQVRFLQACALFSYPRCVSMLETLTVRVSLEAAHAHGVTTASLFAGGIEVYLSS